MTTGQPSEDAATGAEENRPSSRPGPAASSFDAAQDLLQTALDEIRSTEGTRPAPRPPARPAAAPEPAAKPSDRVGRRRRRQSRPIASAPAPAASPSAEAEFWAAPLASPQPSRRDAAATTGSRSARRRRSAAAAASPPPADEFEGLTDSLYQAPAPGPRRRRRPSAEVATAATLATAGIASSDATALRQPVVPAPGPGPTIVEVETPAPAPAEAEPVETPAPAEAERVETPVPAEAEPVETPAPAEAEPVETDDATATDDDAPTEPEPDEPTVVPLTVQSGTEPGETTSRRRTATIVAALVAALLGIAVLVLVLTAGKGSDSPAVQAGGQARLTFPSTTTPEGATVTRVWELQGPKGAEFEGTLSVANPTAAPLATTVTEVIPKSLAANVSDVTFNPQPVVVKADPIVEYRVTIPAGGTTNLSYAIKVAPDGADRRRLDTWARDLPPDTTTTTTTTTPPPTTPATTSAPTTPATTPPRTTPAPTAAPNPPPTSPPEPPPTNPPVTTGTIGITVISRGYGGTFGYATPAGGVSLTTPGANGSAGWSATVDAGVYTLTQTSAVADQPNVGFYIASIACSNGATGSGTSVTVTVNPGESVFCTFENRPA